MKIEVKLQFNVENFPSLENKEPEQNIPIHHRRSTTLMNAINNESYSYISQGSMKKKNNTNRRYNQEEYNQRLNNSNGHFPNTTSQPSQINRETNETSMNQGFIHILKLLSELQKEHTFNFITKLLKENGIKLSNT